MSTIKLAIFDVDGVLTNGQLFFFPGGEGKAFHVHDGLGMKKLMTNGVEVAIITKRESQAVTDRMNELGIQHVYQGVQDKVACFQNLLGTLNITANDCAYLGDDEPDLAVMKQVAWPVAVANATPAVKSIAKFQTQKEGGFGAAREFCEAILERNGTV